MTTELLDVIDSAVKIGLGGLISGIATYSVTGRLNKHDKDKILNERECLLLGEIASHFEKIDDCTDQFLSEFHIFCDSEKKDFKNTKTNLRHQLSKACVHIGEMKAKSNLLGFSKIFDLLERYILILDDLNCLTFSLEDSIEKFQMQLNQIFLSIRELRKEIYPELSNAYKQLKT